MARLRLFANLREIAGTGSVEIPGRTVGEVLDVATQYFGPEFAGGLSMAQVWVNGVRAGNATTVGENDEIALVPPVSGGTSLVRSPMWMEVGLVVVLVAVLFIANSIDIQALAVTTVVAGCVWVYDVTDVAGRRGLFVGAIPLMFTICGSVVASYAFGIPGMAAATVGGGLIALVWAVVTPRLRPLDSVASTVLLATVTAFGSGSMMLLRLRSQEEVAAFLLVATVSVAASWIAGAADISTLDPFTVGIVTALGAGGVAGALWSEELWPMVVASAGAAIALIAGRNLGSLARSGGFYLVGALPGSLHYLDGVMMAAGTFWVMLRLMA